MKQNPLLITEITRIVCTFIDPKDLVNLSLTCRVLYHESCARLWHTLNPKSYRTLRRIKQTLEATKEYNNKVWKFRWSARDDVHPLERQFFDSFLFPNLRELEFSNAAAQDHIVYPMIASSPHLRSLDLSHCYCLSTDAIRPLLSMPCNRLESLVLYGCGKIDPQVMSAIIQRNAATLKRIRLTDITDTILDAIQQCQRLEDLGLEHCNDTTLSNTALNRFFNALSKNQVQLTQLRLRDIDNLTSTHLTSIATSATGISLLHLDMSECYRVKSDGVLCLATQCTSLTHVSLAYQHGVTDRAIQMFMTNCHYLKHMDVSGCALLTDQAFFPILDDGDEQDGLIPIILETLNVSGLDLVTAHTIHQLLTRLPRLLELSLGVTYDLDEADRILDIVNPTGLRFYIDENYTICRIQPHLRYHTRMTTPTLIEPNHDTIILPSTSTWTLPPSLFQLE